MRQPLRNLALTAHVVFSVGWIGAVACFLALAIVALIAPSSRTASATAMALTTCLVIVPLGVGSLVTGIVQSLCTPWGLVKHYWILLKLVLTTVSLAVLGLHLAPIADLANADLGIGNAVNAHARLAGAAAAAIAVLVFMTALSIYKPKGLTEWIP
jgi:hypothetical protein